MTISSEPLTTGEAKRPRPETTGRFPETMGGLAKGLAIIEAFTPSRPQLTISDAARESGTTPAAARRCLLTLEELGYVTYDGKFFRPTPRLMRLCAAYAEIAPLPQLAQPRLEAVREELGESASLAVLDGDNTLFIARAEVARLASPGVRLGSSLPAHASATGRVLLAALADDELDARLSRATMLQTTAYTLITVPEIRERVELVRREGAAYTDEELELGVRTMAVPVVDVAGQTQGAMSVSALAARTSIEQMREHFFPVLRREAHRLGQML